MTRLERARDPKGEPRGRSLFYVFAGGSAVRPDGCELHRPRRHAEPFERDERGLRLAAAAGHVVAEHAPRLLGRFTVGGVEASVESAATGSRVTSLLTEPGSRAEKLRRIDEMATWIVEIGCATRAPAPALACERARLHETVVPGWRDAVPGDIVTSLAPLPAVLQHNDLGCWNILADDRTFTVVDWESARERAFPLWDLLYFLLDAPARRALRPPVASRAGPRPYMESKPLTDWPCGLAAATRRRPIAWAASGLFRQYRLRRAMSMIRRARCVIENKRHVTVETHPPQLKARAQC